MKKLLLVLLLMCFLGVVWGSYEINLKFGTEKEAKEFVNVVNNASDVRLGDLHSDVKQEINIDVYTRVCMLQGCSFGNIELTWTGSNVKIKTDEVTCEATLKPGEKYYLKVDYTEETSQMQTNLCVFLREIT